METRSNKIFVALFVALLLAALVAFTVWMTGTRRSSGRPYDIHVNQSVSGLVVGSPVTFSGVPVGRVTSVELVPGRPGEVRVRLDITNDDLALTEGTVARLRADLLFGTALISLDRDTAPGRPLVARAGEDAPRIPLKSGGIGDVASDPTALVESLAAVTDRLLSATSGEQQRMLTARLGEMEESTAQVAAGAPTLGARIARTRQTLADGTVSTVGIGRQARLMRRDLDRRSRTATAELRSSLSAARDATTALNQRLQTTRSGAQGFSEDAVGASEMIKSARGGIAAVTEQVQQVESSGLGGLISGPPTPNYKPPTKR